MVDIIRSLEGKLTEQDKLLEVMADALGGYTCYTDCDAARYKDGSCSQGGNCGKDALKALAQYKTYKLVNGGSK